MGKITVFVINALILSLVLNNQLQANPLPGDSLSIDFLGNQVSVSVSTSNFPSKDGKSIHQLALAYEKWMSENIPSALIEKLIQIKNSPDQNDWFYYQMVRKVANTFVPKINDYVGYTMCKWFLLNKTGFDAAVLTSVERIMLYVRSDDVIFNQPIKVIDGSQFVNINYHDYGYTVDDAQEYNVIFYKEHCLKEPFSFKIEKLPKLPESSYENINISFPFQNNTENLQFKVNRLLKGIYTNYPVTEYANQFSIPVSFETESSLLNALKIKISTLDKRKGLEYLLHFTRYSFDFERDTDFFGREKRLSPEETILYGKSDCEDRAALFFYLVKKIYDLPMIVLSYANHVNIGVALERPVGKGVLYNGLTYTICEPTPQLKDFALGSMDNATLKEGYEIAFAYLPNK